MIPAVDATDQDSFEFIEDLVLEGLERVTWPKILLFTSKDLLEEALILLLSIGSLTQGCESLFFVVEELLGV